MTFIPIRYPDLRNHIMQDFPEMFTDPTNRTLFKDLCRKLSIRNHTRMVHEFKDWQDDYAFMDPDVDTKLPVPFAHLSKPEQESAFESWLAVFRDLLKDGEFVHFSAKEFDLAAKGQGLEGLRVKHVSKDLIQTHLWFREVKDIEKPFRSWRTCFCEKLVPSRLYSRLVMLFRVLHTNQELEDMRKAMPWYKRLFIKRDLKISSQQLHPSLVYLKYFKDVDINDVDMMMPGTVVKFSWFDWLMIWGPILFGFGAAIYKAANQTLDFDTASSTLTSIFLVLMPLTWGMKAYSSIKDKAKRYEQHLNTIFLLHNLNNNSGVVSQLMDEAEEQEDSEAMLAYFFLWRAQTLGESMDIEQVDHQSQEYLNTLFRKLGGRTQIDFDVHDGVDDLRNFGVLSSVKGGEREILKVVSLSEAVDLCDVRHLSVEERKPHVVSGGVVPGGTLSEKMVVLQMEHNKGETHNGADCTDTIPSSGAHPHDA